MKNKSLISGAAAGALAAAMVSIGAHAAGNAPVGAVNPAPVAPPAAAAPASFADIVQRVAPAVVSIDVEGKAGPRRVAMQGGRGGQQPFGFGQGDDNDDEDSGSNPFGFDFRQLVPQAPGGQDAAPTQATGSGFFISADGYIVTNNHVIDGAQKITVRTADDQTLKARLIGRDEATDLAVIKVEGGNHPFVSFEERAKPRVGDWVIAVGNPFNLGGTATAGIVSALGRPNVSGSSYVDYLQIDAPINRGNSGGPTFDLYGRVVGVNTAIFSPSGGSVGIGFDIPADVAASVSKQLIASGKVTRGYIGAMIQNVSADIADSLGVSGQKGALVNDLTPGGPAEKAGLRPGDLVTKVNGHEVTSASDLTRQVGLARAGEDIRLEVRRDGQVRQMVVRSGLRPSEDSLASNDRQRSPDADSADGGNRVLGMQLAPNAKGSGVAVEGVASNSDAAGKGLRRGDVILRAGTHDVATAADVSAAAAEARKAGRSSVLLQVSRNGQRMFLPLKVDEGRG